MQRAAAEEHGMPAELGHRRLETHASAGGLLVEHHCKGDVLEKRQAHAFLLHFLEQQAGVEQLVDLLDAPVAQAVHVHVVFVLHFHHSLDFVEHRLSGSIG